MLLKVHEPFISDMHMPGMDGVSLLRSIREKHPQLLRFMLSGESTREGGITNAVGGAHQLLNKPIQADELFETMTLSHSLYNQISDPDLQRILSSIKTIPSPQQTYFEISKCIEDPNLLQTTVETSSIESHRHGLVGAALLAIWGIPSRIVEAVAFHDHNPENAELSSFSHIIKIAEAIIHHQNHHSGADFWETSTIDPKIANSLNLQETISDFLSQT